MQVLNKFEAFHVYIKQNRWYWYFSIFCRYSLALGFVIAGTVKILGERFASGLSEIHPMGAYLEALYHTGYYYTFIGIVQIVAGVFLIIPKTSILGALIYFPIIVNIWILSWAVRFDGSLVSSTLMVFANTYLLVWNYDRLQHLLPVTNKSNIDIIKKPKSYNNRFPYKFFLGVFITMVLTVFLAANVFTIMPKNSLSQCQQQFRNSKNKIEGYDFCDCVHLSGNDLEHCLSNFKNNIKTEKPH